MRRGGWGAAAVGCGPVAVGCVARPGWGCPCASGGKRQSSCVWTRVRFVSWCTVGCRGGGGETPACRWRLINSPAWAGGGGCCPPVRAVASGRDALLVAHRVPVTWGIPSGAPSGRRRPPWPPHVRRPPPSPPPPRPPPRPSLPPPLPPRSGGRQRAWSPRAWCHRRRHRRTRGGLHDANQNTGPAAASLQRQAAGNRLGRRAPLGSPARQAAARRQPPRPRRHAKPAAVSVLPCFVGVRLGCALPTFGTPASPPQEPLVSSNLRLWSIPIIGRRHGHRRQQLRQRPQQHRCILARVSSATICSICVGRANRNDSRRQRGATRGYVPRRGGRHADRGRHTGGVVGGSNAHGRSGRRVAYDRPRPPPPAAAIAGGRERG